MKLTPKSVEFFNLIAQHDGELTRATLAIMSGRQPPTVSMYLTALRHHNLIDAINGKYFVAKNDLAQKAKKDPNALGIVDGRQPDPNSRLSQARKLFQDLMSKGTHTPRKDMIAAMVSQCSLTPQGAATYLQTFRKEAGLVHSNKQ